MNKDSTSYSERGSKSLPDPEFKVLFTEDIEETWSIPTGFRTDGIVVTCSPYAPWNEISLAGVMVQVLFEAAEHAFFFGRWPKEEAARILGGKIGSSGPFTKRDDVLAVVGGRSDRQKLVLDIRTHAGWTGLHALAITPSMGEEVADRFATAFEGCYKEPEADRAFDRLVDHDWSELAQAAVWPSGDGDLSLVLCSKDLDMGALADLLRQGAGSLGIECRKVNRSDPEYTYF